MKRVAAVVLLKESGAALFQLRDNKPGLPCANQWSLPSGRCESTETLKDCAKRELKEETAYQCESLHDLVTLQPNHDGYERYQMTAFWAPYDGLQALECLEGQAIQFIERSDAKSYAIPEFILKVWDLAFQEMREMQ